MLRTVSYIEVGCLQENYAEVWALNPGLKPGPRGYGLQRGDTSSKHIQNKELSVECLRSASAALRPASGFQHSLFPY
ncbi:hypothetical protein PBY51_004508 [Eleginops maclovinus]|uniref:Uncharacterized protein n=1 Tax=Eleginops maclovinus TaxID=56733 RepID=A0AAN7Y3B9_ELEMC|nr:hypothetical protein PBY51_004508 [Eleginops maclovinus]